MHNKSLPANVFLSMRWLLLFFPLYGGGQELLLNGGFEEENICTEYKINCAPQAWVCTVPSFSHYLQNKALAKSGTHCIELVAAQKAAPFFRSYIRTQLVCALQKGKTYRLSLWVRSAQPVLDSVGVYFSAHDFLFDNRPHNSISASIYLQSFTPAPKKDSQWQKLTTEFKAAGTEQFLTIGNFKRNSFAFATDALLFYVDEVSLTPADKNERLCANYHLQVKKILAYHDRHELQAAWMQQRRNKPVPVEKLSPTITIQIDTFTVPDVFFGSNSFLLHQKSFSRLDSFARWLAPQAVDSVVIQGHTDAMGSEGDNKILSWRRAGTVAAYLKKTAAKNYILYGWGSSRPVATNNTAKGRQRNRRVEILLYRRLP